MRRSLITMTLAALAAVLLALPAAAQDRPPIGVADGMAMEARHGGSGILRCLRGLNLSDSQKADIKAILDAARPTFEADIAALKAAHQKIDADYTANAGAAVLGQDYIALRAAGQKLKDDKTATDDLVLGKLDDSQKSAAEACLAAHAAHGQRAIVASF
jgi:Spy/CpxP family protein refolding chaperone